MTQAARSVAPHLVTQHVGVRLRARRKLCKLTLEALAERLEVTYQQIQKYERGHNRISACMLYRMAQVLDAPVAYFFEGLADVPVATVDPRPELDQLLALPAGLRLTQNLISLPPGVRRRLADLTEELVQFAPDGA